MHTCGMICLHSISVLSTLWYAFCTQSCVLSGPEIMPVKQALKKYVSCIYKLSRMYVPTILFTEYIYSRIT